MIQRAYFHTASVKELLKKITARTKVDLENIEECIKMTPEMHNYIL